MDTDSDNDGIPDEDEINGPDGIPGTGDETDPANEDSDGDGWTDLQEQICGSDPNDPADTCDGFGDQIPGGVATTLTIPYQTQVQLGDVMFILDETGSMQGTLDDVASRATHRGVVPRHREGPPRISRTRPGSRAPAVRGFPGAKKCNW